MKEYMALQVALIQVMIPVLGITVSQWVERYSALYRELYHDGASMEEIKEALTGANIGG